MRPDIGLQELKKTSTKRIAKEQAGEGKSKETNLAIEDIFLG